MLGFLARKSGTLGRLAVGGVRKLSNIPLVKTVAKQTAFGAALYGAGNMLSGPSGGGGLPALPGMLPAGAPAAMGQRGLFANDPNIIEALKPYAISKGNLKPYFRAPKGFVIVYDQVGDPYALPKKLAQWAKLWKPSHKPPISVGDYQALKRADRTVRKMRKIFSMTARVDKNTTKGGKVRVKK